MATHSILAWRIPQTVESSGLQLWVLKESDVAEQLTLPYYHLPLAVSSVRSAVESTTVIIVSPGSNNLDLVLLKMYLLKE